MKISEITISAALPLHTGSSRDNVASLGEKKQASLSSLKVRDDATPSREETSGSEIDYSPDSDDISFSGKAMECEPARNPLERFLPNISFPSCGSGDSAIATPVKTERRFTTGSDACIASSSLDTLTWDNPLSGTSAPESVYSSPPFARLREGEFRQRLGRRLQSNHHSSFDQRNESSNKPASPESSSESDKKRTDEEAQVRKRALNNSFNSYQSPAWKMMQDSLSTRDQRTSRQARFGRPKLNYTVILNSVKIHVYDLLEHETVMRLWNSCDCPLGKVFQAVNNGLHCLGSGAYHAGIEVNGVEYSYGYSPLKSVTGVFTNLPKRAHGHQYRTTIDFGEIKTTKKISMLVPVELSVSDDENSTSFPENSMKSPMQRTSPRSIASFLDMDDADSGPSFGKSSGGRVKGKLVEKICEVPVNGNAVMSELAFCYMGSDYDILRYNCCHFVKGACIALGIKETEIPTWFMNLAAIGVATEDAIVDFETTVINPFKKIFVRDDNNSYEEEVQEEGFEVIEHPRNGRVPKEKPPDLDESNIPFKRTLTWTY